MKKPATLLFLMLLLISSADCMNIDEISPKSVPLEKASFVNCTMQPEQDQFITMEDWNLKVHYKVIGKGPIDIVFIPGWTNPLEIYTKQFDYFRDKARCIYIDLPGTGKSDAPSPSSPLNPDTTGLQYTMEFMAQAVYKIVQQEKLHQFAAIGFSMGPRVWGMFERAHPGMITKLIDIDGGYMQWPTDPAERDTFLATRKATYQAQLNLDISTKQHIDSTRVPPNSPKDLLAFVSYFSEFPNDILANTFYHANDEIPNQPLDWKCPIMFIFSEPSPDMGMIDLYYPGATIHSFPGGGHVIHWVFHKEINPILWDFIIDGQGKK